VTSGADDVDLGREVCDDFCVSCHGRDMVAPGGVTFDLRKFPKDDFERFRKAVLEGKPPALPAWRDKISDDDVKLLWAYVRGRGLGTAVSPRAGRVPSAKWTGP
jgi:mono/diheme cytochrome c family protein